MSLESRIESLAAKHADFERQISDEESRSLPDSLKLHGQKKRKLRVKEAWEACISARALAVTSPGGEESPNNGAVDKSDEKPTPEPQEIDDGNKSDVEEWLDTGDRCDIVSPPQTPPRHPASLAA